MTPVDAKHLTSKVLTVYDNLQAVGVSLRDSLSALMLCEVKIALEECNGN